MKPTHTDQFLNFCCELSRQLIQNGAEIYRVEESADRLLAAYGYENAEVFAIPSCVILNIQEGEKNYNKTIRIRSSSNNLDKLDKLNDLCRRVCRSTPPIEEAQERLRAIVEAPVYSRLTGYLAHGFVAAFFTLFWGGRALDAVVAFLCGMSVKATLDFMGRMNTNLFFTYICASMLLESIPLSLLYGGVPLKIDRIVIGAIMLLVPGIAITNVMRDVIAGDFLTALTKSAEVLIVAMAIAIGIAIPYGVAVLLWGGI